MTKKDEAVDQVDKDFPPVVPAEENTVVTLGSDPFFPEAKGIAYATVYSRTGVAINVTSRAESPRKAVDGLFDVIKYAMETYGCTAGNNQKRS